MIAVWKIGKLVSIVDIICGIKETLIKNMAKRVFLGINQNFEGKAEVK